MWQGGVEGCINVEVHSFLGVGFKTAEAGEGIWVLGGVLMVLLHNSVPQRGRELVAMLVAFVFLLELIVQSGTGARS